MKVELYHPDQTDPDVVGNVKQYQFDNDYRLLFLYDVKDVNRDVDPIAVVVVDQWALIKFVE